MGNKSINFEGLEQINLENEELIYPKTLIEELKRGKFKCLNEINPVDRTNREFMEPLLYAVRNEKNTYIVYKFCGENIQEDLGLLIEVVLDDPSIIEDTPVSGNKELMLNIVEIKPSVIPYIADSLMTEPGFKEELQDLQYKGVDIGLKIRENIDLRNNVEFMKEAINEDAHFFQFASEELKNSYEFVREVSKENSEVIDYVVEHTEEFGKEALRGTKESLSEHIEENVEEKIKIEKERIKQEKEEKGLEPDEETQEEKQLERNENTIKRLEGRFKKIIEAAYAEGMTFEEQKKAHERVIRTSSHFLNLIEMPEDTRSMLEKYRTLSEAELEKIMENHKIKTNQEELSSNSEVSGNQDKRYGIEPFEIENKVGGALPSEMNGQKGVMAGLLREIETKEKNGTGGIENGSKSKD